MCCDIYLYAQNETLRAQSERVKRRLTKTQKQDGHEDIEIQPGGQSRFRRREREQEEKREVGGGQRERSRHGSMV